MSRGFTPIMISFAKKEFEQAQERAKEKERLLEEAISFCKSELKIESVNARKLSNNMIKYFKDLTLETFKDQNTMGLSAEKLIEVKELNIYILENIQKHYEAMSEEINFDLSRPRVKVSRKDYETYTASDRQNTILLTGQKFITALKELEKERECAKMLVSKLTNGYVVFNPYENKYIVNPELLRYAV